MDKRKLLLIIGIILVVICAFTLLFSILNFYGYYHVLDGSSELYLRLHRRGIIFLIIGIILLILGILCFIMRSKY